MVIRALVVGGTGGIGYSMACRLAAEANTSSVIISGRTKPADIPHANIEFRRLDASSMRQIKQYTDAFKSSQDQQLDYLIMTQGILSTAGRTETPEGIDRKMALHYYGKQLLIRELLPVLKDDAKVIFVLDGQSGNPSKLNWDDLDLKETYGLGASAQHCIGMTDAMVQYHAAQQKQQGLQKRHFVHAYPGIVDTNLSATLPWYMRSGVHVLNRLVGVSSETCAERLLKGTTESTAAGEKAGRFWSNIDDKGHFIAKKAIWSDEQLAKVSEHTWTLLDKALETPES